MERRAQARHVIDERLLQVDVHVADNILGRLNGDRSVSIARCGCPNVRAKYGTPRIAPYSGLAHKSQNLPTDRIAVASVLRFAKEAFQRVLPHEFEKFAAAQPLGDWRLVML